MSKDLREKTITGRELIDLNAPYRVMSRLVVPGGETREDLEGRAFWSQDDARRERDKRRAEACRHPARLGSALDPFGCRESENERKRQKVKNASVMARRREILPDERRKDWVAKNQRRDG